MFDFGLYTQVSDSGPQGPLVLKNSEKNLLLLSAAVMIGTLRVKFPALWWHWWHKLVLIGWFIGFGFYGPLRQYFSLYRAVSQREGERGKKG